MREGYQMTELGEIPIDWRVKQINEVTSYVDYRGKTPPKVSKGICLITARNIKRGKIDYNLSEEYVPVNQYNVIMSRGFPKIGDVLITTEAPLGEIATIDNENVALAQRIIKYRGLPETLNNLYLKHTLMGPYFQELLEKESTGSTVKGIKGSRLHKLSILIPPLQEQQKIATILSTVDEKIEVIDAQIAQTRELKKGLMQKLLTRGIGHTKFQDSVLGEIPESWKVSNLESHSHFITKGSTPTTYGFEWQESGITFLRSECVSPNGFSLSGAMHISEEANKAMERSKIKGGDILMTITGNVGRTCIYPMEYKEGNINQHIARIRISDSLLLPQFVFQYLSQSSIITEYLKITTGQAYPQLSLKQVRETKIPLPSIEEQQKIALLLSTIDEKLKIQHDKKTEYQQLKKGLMQQLLTGKVRVFQSELEIA